MELFRSTIRGRPTLLYLRFCMAISFQGLSKVRTGSCGLGQDWHEPVLDAAQLHAANWVKWWVGYFEDFGAL